MHWGRVPVWGFGDVVESDVAGVAEGTRVYGYFPLADELVVAPGRIDDRGFSDSTPTREAVPTVYSRYSVTTADRVYRPEREDQQMLLWPLFVTSFVVDDFLGDHDLFGARTVVVSSASSKTAIGAAFLLAERDGVERGRPDVAGQPGVRPVAGLLRLRPPLRRRRRTRPTDRPCYIDVAGRKDVTHAVHTRLGGALRYSMVVGDTHWDDATTAEGTLPGPPPEFLFAPVQIAKRRTDWGRDGFEEAVAEAWDRFVPWTDGWLTIRHAAGAAATEAVYRDVLDGRVDPRTGDICTLVRIVGSGDDRHPPPPRPAPDSRSRRRRTPSGRPIRAHWTRPTVRRRRATRDRRAPTAPGPQPRGRGRRPARPLHRGQSPPEHRRDRRTGRHLPPVPVPLLRGRRRPGRRGGHPPARPGPCPSCPIGAGARRPVRRPGGRVGGPAAPALLHPRPGRPRVPAAGARSSPGWPTGLAEGRRFLRGQVRSLFAPELAAMPRRPRPRPHWPPPTS